MVINGTWQAWHRALPICVSVQGALLYGRATSKEFKGQLGRFSNNTKSDLIGFGLSWSVPKYAT